MSANSYTYSFLTNADGTPIESVPLNSKSMEYVRLGSSGLKVSRIALGCMTYGSPEWRPWVLNRGESQPFIRAALENGINFFDTSDFYSNGESEMVLGSTLKEFGTSREDLVIATKVFFPISGNGPNNRGLSRKHLMDAIDASLRRLQMSYVDLYQIHRWDKECSTEEVMEALHDIVKSGKVRYIGASSMAAWEFQHCQSVAEKHGWTKFISMQNCYNLVYREEEREMNPYCQFSGVGILPWSPLARGFLTAAGARSTTKEAKSNENASIRAKTDTIRDRMEFLPEDHEIADRVAQLAEKHGVKPAQIALSWLLHKSVVSAPIIGASKLYQLEEAVAAIKIKLDKDEMKFLEEKYKPHAAS